MPTPKRGPRLGSGPAHQKLMLANLASDLFRHGRVRTTEAKARALRPYAEKLVTKAKQGDLHARRQVIAKLRDRDVVAYLFDDVAPRFADRSGGYTRILKLGPRAGDHAPMALIELVDRGERSGDEAIEESKVGRSRGLFGRRRRAQEAATGTAPAFDVEDDEQVAAAIARATGADEDAEASPESSDSADSVDSPDSADSADEADEDDSRA